jgi:putative two-component system response regulator
VKELKKFEDTTILTVDDDEFNQAMAVAIFDDFENIHMLQASQGIEAFEILNTEVIDLILLDLIMPEMDGFETLKRLKENPEYRDIPVIVITSKNEEKRATYELGANDFISKPYSPEELKLRVYNHLKVKKFSELLNDIKVDSSLNISSSEQLSHLQEAIKIAIGSEKKLLLKLGNLSYESIEEDQNRAKRMGEYAKVIAKVCGLNSKEIDNLYHVMFIYDIGLLRIPPEYRLKSDSKEFKAYPELGLSILNDLEETTLIKMAKEVIYSHQENWDGSGYPQALKEEEIPLYARVASIINFYDELTASRVYSPNILNSDDALDIIKREKGIKFDPNILTLFVENFELFKNVKNRWSNQ